jgi:outer membrane biosynthesis protein TonB
MSRRGKYSLVRIGAMLAVASALAACTKGGQFDPTTLLDSDMFDSKKPLQGTREPVFPSGVPGATTGIPADLYRGYQPPPDQAAAAAGATPITPTVGEQPKPAAVAEAPQPKPKLKPKPKPKPKLARAPEQSPTRISVGLRKQSAPQQDAQPAQTAWPAPSGNQAQSSQTAWPAPPSTNQAQSSQTVWPAPPPTGGGQPAQSSQSVWPNPPPTGSGSQ